MRKLYLVLAVAAVFVAGVACLFINHLFPDADTLLHAHLYKDLFEDGGSWNFWAVGGAPCYFPDMALYFIVRFFISDVILSLAIANIIFYLTLLLLFLYIYKTIYGKPDSTVAVMILLIASVINYKMVLSPPFPLQYCFILLTHSGATISAIACAGLVLQYLFSESPAKSGKYLLAIFVVSFLITVSDKLFAVVFIAPMTLSLLLAWLTCRISIKKLFGIIFSAYVPAIIALWLAPLLNPYHSIVISMYQNREWAHSYKALFDFFGNVKGLNGDELVFYIVIAAIVAWALISPARLAVNFRSQGSDDTVSIKKFIFMIYIASAVLGNIAATIYFGIYLDLRHYFNYVNIVPMFCLPMLVYDNNRSYGKYSGKLKTILFITLLAGAMYFSIAPIVEYYNGHLQNKNYPNLVKCLDDNKERYQLTNGLAGYWQTRPVTLLSKKGIVVNQITAEGKIYFWANNLDWYLKIKEYNFIIATDLHRKLIADKFGTYKKSFKCGYHEVFVYDKNNNLASEMIYQYEYVTTKGEFEKKFIEDGVYNSPAALLPSRIGKIDGWNRVAGVGDGVGHLIYGPYLKAPKGKYKLSLTYSTGSDTPPVVNWDIVAEFENGQEILATGEIGQPGVQEGIVSQKINLPDVAVIEFRVLYHGVGLITIHSVTIEKI